jgi:hypothetical protein
LGWVCLVLFLYTGHPLISEEHLGLFFREENTLYKGTIRRNHWFPKKGEIYLRFLEAGILTEPGLVFYLYRVFQLQNIVLRMIFQLVDDALFNQTDSGAKMLQNRLSVEFDIEVHDNIVILFLSRLQLIYITISHPAHW